MQPVIISHTGRTDAEIGKEIGVFVRNKIFGDSFNVPFVQQVTYRVLGGVKRMLK